MPRGPKGGTRPGSPGDSLGFALETSAGQDLADTHVCIPWCPGHRADAVLLMADVDMRPDGKIFPHRES